MSHAGEVSSPSHHLMAIWCSLGSRLRPRPGDWTAESHAEAWGDDKNNNYYYAILHHSYAILCHEQKAELKMMALYIHALCPTLMYMTS